jgi:hypothetical protein
MTDVPTVATDELVEVTATTADVAALAGLGCDTTAVEVTAAPPDVTAPPNPSMLASMTD